MTINRRDLFHGTLLAGAALAVRKAGAAAKPAHPLVVPDGAALQGTLVGGVKVFHLTAGAFEHEIAPGLVVTAWGYNGSTPGPVLEATEGDRVRIYVTNALPEPTTIHWHGILLPNGMDGVGGLNQDYIQPGETWSTSSRCASTARTCTTRMRTR